MEERAMSETGVAENADKESEEGLERPSAFVKAML
jgi:hypothetical protein